MKFTLVVMRGPGNGRGQERAQGFARALLDQDLILKRVFFYGDGARTALPSEQPHIQFWSSIADIQGSDLVICSASAERCGALHPPEPFTLMGLGALMEAGYDSDRIISFD